MIEINTLIVSPFQQNCRILSVPGSTEAVVVDPGAESSLILADLARRNLRLSQIWLTHSHLDHCGAVAKLKKAGQITLYAHASEQMLRSSVVSICGLYGISQGIMEDCPEPDVCLVGGETLELAGETFEVFHTPGHSTGSLCYYHAASGQVIVGDVIFSGSIGRTDLPGGDSDTLMKSIRTKILSLSPETRLLCGHGQDTDVGTEQKHNPFLN